MVCDVSTEYKTKIETLLSLGDFICTSKTCTTLIPITVKQFVGSNLEPITQNDVASLNDFTSIQIGVKTEFIVNQGLQLTAVECITSSTDAAGSVGIEVSPFLYNVKNTNFNQTGYLFGSELSFQPNPDFSQCTDSVYKIKFGEMTRFRCQLSLTLPADATCAQSNEQILTVIY